MIHDAWIKSTLGFDVPTFAPAPARSDPLVAGVAIAAVARAVSGAVSSMIGNQSSQSIASKLKHALDVLARGDIMLSGTADLVQRPTAHVGAASNGHLQAALKRAVDAMAAPPPSLPAMTASIASASASVSLNLSASDITQALNAALGVLSEGSPTLEPVRNTVAESVSHGAGASSGSAMLSTLQRTLDVVAAGSGFHAPVLAAVNTAVGAVAGKGGQGEIVAALERALKALTPPAG